MIPHFLDGLPDRWPDTPCRNAPHLFVDNRSTPAAERTKEAKALCAGCPVRTACADHAIRNGIRDGIYGGLTIAERDAVVRERAAADE
ncbi:WhiB family transcriptional regulator [Streptomyces sp. enrichment culture]|uniref:WhiB family transcriptional regulator n=1 Tax=Streptomyces sp. enrichment culture TaxID=1795815 RepID=UPI003F550CB1